MTKLEGKTRIATVKELFSTHPDGLKEIVRTVLQEVLEAEMTEALAAEKGERWDCQDFCARGRFRHWLTNLSPKTRANWVLASNHSRGGRLHSSAAWFNTKNSSFMAASSLGKWPRVRTARRSFEFNASMAFVTGMRMAVPISRRGFSTVAYGATIRDRGTGSTKVWAGRC